MRTGGKPGIILAVKPHIYASVYNIATTQQMLDEIDSPALGVSFDTFQLFKSGRPCGSHFKIRKKIVHAILVTL